MAEGKRMRGGKEIVATVRRGGEAMMVTRGGRGGHGSGKGRRGGINDCFMQHWCSNLPLS